MFSIFQVCLWFASIVFLFAPIFSILQTFQSFFYSTSPFYYITFYKVLNKCLGKIPICVTCHVLGSYCQTHFSSLIYMRIYFIIYKKSYTKWYTHKNLNKKLIKHKTKIINCRYLLYKVFPNDTYSLNFLCVLSFSLCNLHIAFSMSLMPFHSSLSIFASSAQFGLSTFS